jgi:hypothetical protein
MEEEEYFRLIEDYFLQKRGNPVLLTPKEWALMGEWHDAGIPGEVVIRAIERGFEKKKPEEFESPINLVYFRRLVKSEYKKHLKSQEGLEAKSSEPAQDVASVQEFLERLVHALRESSERARGAGNEPMTGLLEGCREKLAGDVLQTFRDNAAKDLQRVEHQLATLEKEIEKGLLQTISETQLNNLREDAMRDLKSFEDKVDWPVYQEMINRALIKSIRKLYNIPRLSLFYM